MPKGCKVGTGQARGRALNSGHCMAGGVAGYTKFSTCVQEGT